MPKELITGKMMMVSGEREVEVVIDGRVHYHVDNNHGADADNRRGVRTTIIDEVTDIGFYNEDGDEVKYTEADKNKAAEILGNKLLGV